MAIDRLSSTAALIAALRSDATRKNSASTSSGATARTPERPAAGRPSIAQLRLELAALVKEVSLDDAEAIRNVRPRLVKAILLWEFGASLREHPEWKPMMDNIVQTLEADSRQNEQFVALIRELKTRQ
jgi:hypothetical protein